jgi:hypothetical protein
MSGKGFSRTTPASEFHRYSVGLGHVGSYQASARPYLTSSLTIPVSSSAPFQVDFESVSRFIVITNTTPGSATNVPLRFGFSAAGVRGDITNNYAILNNGESFEAEFKVVSVFLLSDSGVNECSASVIAGLTGIDNSHLANNWSGSVGIG